MLSNIKGAVNSIWNNKITSMLTIMGVVIGVTAVIVLVSLGQGLKNDVSNMIQGLGSNVLAVIGGKIDPSNLEDSNQANPAQFIASDILTIEDVETIEKLERIDKVSPMSMVSASLKYQDKTSSPTIIGVKSNFSEIMNILKLKEGRLFRDGEKELSIIISDNLRIKLFGEEDPIGKQISLSSYQFNVVGVLEKPSDSVMGNEYNNMSVIPFDTATLLNKNQTKIYRIIVKAEDDADIKQVQTNIKNALLINHNNEEDFSVLTQDDLLGLIDQFLSLATAMVTAIAAISLLVGGIGIMNIMLITVTERTKEIGLRKAVGASKNAILFQFLIEAIVITLIGGIIGLMVSFSIVKIVEYKTTLTPVITPSIILMSLGISTLTGIIFGLWPAMRAASKDPIEALRRE